MSTNTNIRPIPTKVYRITLSELEIVAALEALQYQNQTHGLDTQAKAVLIKFQKYAVEFQYGTKTPAYVATGVKKQAGVNLNALGASEQEIAFANASADAQMNATFERGTYELEMKVRLPEHRFLNKTWQQVREEELGVLDKNQITDVNAKEIPYIQSEEDSNKSDFDGLFGPKK